MKKPFSPLPRVIKPHTLKLFIFGKVNLEKRRIY